MRLSVIIIARDAEATVRRCIESVAWADEVVVVDSGSTDATPQICRELGAKVHQTEDWPGFGPQKNRALERAAGDWVLSLDTDEWVSAELRTELVHWDAAVLLREVLLADHGHGMAGGGERPCEFPHVAPHSPTGP